MFKSQHQKAPLLGNWASPLNLTAPGPAIKKHETEDKEFVPRAHGSKQPNQSLMKCFRKILQVIYFISGISISTDEYQKTCIRKENKTIDA